MWKWQHIAPTTNVPIKTRGLILNICFSVIFSIPNESNETINNAGQNHIAPIRGSKQANLTTIFTPHNGFIKRQRLRIETYLIEQIM